MKIGDLVKILPDYRSGISESFVGIIVDSVEDESGYLNFNVVLDNNSDPEWYIDFELEVIGEAS